MHFKCTLKSPYKVVNSGGWFFIRILPRNAKLSLSLAHDCPALVNEFHEMKLTVENEEDVKISNVR